FHATAGDKEPYLVATVTYDNPYATGKDLRATVFWGDRSNDVSIVTPGGGGTTFAILASHEYPAAGTFPVTVAVAQLDYSNNLYYAGASTNQSQAIVDPSWQQKVANAFTSVLTDVLKDWLKQVPDLIQKLVDSLSKDDGAKNQSQVSV